ncbi:uncharacterized protein TNCV_3055371 [Trichonephila clavipes]|nr:uncharacterized protein TNCV_3055371 [Trichonephila clavipes]
MRECQSQKQSAFTSRREQLESGSSTRERSVDICSRPLSLDETLYLAPSASQQQQVSESMIPGRAAAQNSNKECLPVGAFPLWPLDAATSAAKNKSWRVLIKLPDSPRAVAAAEFRLSTGHDCLYAHLYRFYLIDLPFSVLCASGQVMDASLLDVCSAL